LNPPSEKAEASEESFVAKSSWRFLTRLRENQRETKETEKLSLPKHESLLASDRPKL